MLGRLVDRRRLQHLRRPTIEGVERPCLSRTFGTMRLDQGTKPCAEGQFALKGVSRR